MVLAFIFNYLIAEALYPWDENPDSNLAARFNIYALILLAGFSINLMDHTRFSKFVISIGIGLCISDVLDRFVFDNTSFQWNDITMIILTLITSYYKYYYVRT